MTEVAIRQEQQLAPAASETTAIISMIERAASDQRVDVDKLERLMAMRERMEAKHAETAFNIAMKNAQAEMRPIGADALNPQTKSKYATYAKLDSVLRQIYTKHGFSLSFDEDDSPKPDHVRVVCYVAHEAGHTRTYRKDMPADGKGAKGGDVMTKTHATGAAASYGARYLLKGIFNIAVGEDDRDGNKPADVETISEDQVMQLRDLIEAVGADEVRFKTFIKVEHLSDILASKFDAAVKLLKQKERR
jgi:hypothetical protein